MAMPHIFTLEEADALLPRLREVLSEMRQKKASLDGLREELASMIRTAAGNGHLLQEEVQRKRSEAKALAEGLDNLLDKLNGMGCELKGLEQGLIDFPAERQGRTVYLCWRLDEARITHWHELEAGYAGRQPL